MFKIGEFSKLARVSARMLRYYDQCGLLVPAATDRFTGYRLYSAGQMPRLGRIVALRDMGFGVEEIKTILPRWDDTVFLQEALSRKALEVEHSIADEQQKLNNIAALRGQLRKEINMIFEVELKPLPAIPVVSLREIIPAYNQEGMLWEKLGRFMAEHNIPYEEKACYALYHDSEYKEGDVDIEVAVELAEDWPQSGAMFKTLEAIPQAATIRFSGPYEGTNSAMEKLAAWIERNGYAIDGTTRSQLIVSPGCGVAPEDYLTELQVPVRKA
jgi:DNA-binding transcriptional MerR regulator/effector-binding domain-containing protein